MQPSLEKPSHEAALNPWWLVLCLVGLDYFSTLAYLPSLAVRAAGPLAPLGALLVVLVTLCIALPVYWYVIARSPMGQGGIGVIERSIHGWRGKLLVLALLAFVTTDFVATQNLSTADAAEHLLANPAFDRMVDRVTNGVALPWALQPKGWVQKIAAYCDRQLVVTLLLTLLIFVLWVVWRKLSSRVVLRWAALVVGTYLTLNAIVLVSSLLHLGGDGRHLLDDWKLDLHAALAEQTGARSTPVAIGRLAVLAVAIFPWMALGLSGFEFSMTVAPMVRGDGPDGSGIGGRVRNMRKLLVGITGLMAVLLPAAVLVVTLLVPRAALRGHGAHRSLAYLAHGGTLADGQPGSVLSPLFGPTFGACYDICSVAILCLAGAGIAVALHDFIPEYLKRMGMEIEWVHQLGVKLRFFNIILLVVAILFRARIEALEWVYTTSVLALLANAALAAFLEVRSRTPTWRWRRVALVASSIPVIFFAFMLVLTLAISRLGLELALAFAVGIFLTSAISRWIRSTELRFDGFRFADQATERRWKELLDMEFQILVPHRPGIYSRTEKVDRVRLAHRIPHDVPLIFIEATLGDTSGFSQTPKMRIATEEGVEVIFVTGCVSTAHVIAATALEMSRTGRPPEIHFGWSDERPLSANLNFLLFGEGNIPWMVRELILRACPDTQRQPKIVVG